MRGDWNDERGSQRRATDLKEALQRRRRASWQWRRIEDEQRRGGQHQRIATAIEREGQHAPRQRRRKHRVIADIGKGSRGRQRQAQPEDRKSTRLNSSHLGISY